MNLYMSDMITNNNNDDIEIKLFISQDNKVISLNRDEIIELFEYIKRYQHRVELCNK